jgi:alpha-glucosidase
MLELDRAALRLRRELGLGVDAGREFSWVDAGADVVAFRRGDGFECRVNLGDTPADLPDGAAVLLASGDVSDGVLPADTAVWLATA